MKTPYRNGKKHAPKGQNTDQQDSPDKDFTIIRNSIIRDRNLSPYAKAIFILIKSYSPSYPSYNRIMELTGIRSRSTINKGLTDLKSKGLIRIIHSPDRRSNQYVFPNPKKMDLPSSLDELGLVHDVDTNKNKLITPTNQIASDASTDPPVETSKREHVFAEALSSLGPDAGKDYQSKERPTMFIEALAK